MKQVDYHFFSVIPMPLAARRKMVRYKIVAHSDAGRIGTIEWYPPWRQYCLFPAPDTAWNKGCLLDIQNFLCELKLERAADEAKAETH